MSYSIRCYREDDNAALLNIVQSVWGAKAVDKFNALHPWYRLRKAAFLDREGDDLVLETAGEVVGYLRRLPCEYLIDGQRVPAAYFIDNVTHPEHRGAGMQLARRVAKTPEILQIGVPTARFNLIWRRIVRPRKIEVAPLERCVVLLRPSAHLEKKGLPKPLGRVADALWRARLWAGFLGTASAHAGPYTLSSESRAPAAGELEQLFATFARDFFGIAVRDSAFFNWRFLGTVSGYRFLWARAEGRLAGYMVYREMQLNGRRVLLIVESMAVGSKQACYLAMLRQVVAEGLRVGAADLQTINSGCKDFYAALKKLGMLVKVEKELLLAHLHSARPFAESLASRHPWYLSLAESDNEFSIYPYTGIAHAA